MKISIVTDVLGESNNGTTMTVKRLIDNLIARGHDVKVVSPSEIELPEYYKLDKKNFGIFNNYIKKNGVELAKPNEETLRKVIADSEVVHIILPFGTGMMAQKICRELKIPYTTAFHCQAENISAHIGLKDFKFINNEIYKVFYRFFYHYAHFVHCPSEFIREELMRHGYDMDLRVISNGVSHEFTSRQVDKPEKYKDKFCILFVGRYSNEKRHDLLIDAAKKSKYRDKIQLIFAGNGPLLEKLEKKSKGLVNPPVFGFYATDELIDVINYSDLYVHPSDIEIEAISCLEAITCGLVPIISNSKRSATNAFAINSHCLFKCGDSNDLSKQIDYFIEHPEEKDAMKAQYMEFAKQFAISNCIDKMEKMFTDSIEYYKNNPEAFQTK